MHGARKTSWCQDWRLADKRRDAARRVIQLEMFSPAYPAPCAVGNKVHSARKTDGRQDCLLIEAKRNCMRWVNEVQAALPLYLSPLYRVPWEDRARRQGKAQTLGRSIDASGYSPYFTFFMSPVENVPNLIIS